MVGVMPSFRAPPYASAYASRMQNQDSIDAKRASSMLEARTAALNSILQHSENAAKVFGGDALGKLSAITTGIPGNVLSNNYTNAADQLRLRGDSANIIETMAKADKAFAENDRKISLQDILNPSITGGANVGDYVNADKKAKFASAASRNNLARALYGSNRAVGDVGDKLVWLTDPATGRGRRIDADTAAKLQERDPSLVIDPFRSGVVNEDTPGKKGGSSSISGGRITTNDDATINYKGGSGASSTEHYDKMFDTVRKNNPNVREIKPDGSGGATVYMNDGTSFKVDKVE